LSTPACCCSSTTCATATAVGDLKDLRRWLSQQTDIVNHAIEDLLATASAITCAGAHGWQAWKIVELAPGQTLIPAVISHDTNVVEHPETWSSTPSWWPRAARQDRRARKHHRQNPSRLCAKAVYRRLRLSIIWAKLQTLAEEARLRARDCGRSLH